MKANGYKDDVAEIVGAAYLGLALLTVPQEDPMKPVLDKLTETIVNSLDGEARTFYNREFTFFHEVTSISGKLKPFVKKTKPEKKVCGL
jgi:phosphatidylinositol 4-kinase A